MTLRSQSPEQREKTKKAERLFAENINFAYWVVHKYFSTLASDEDVVQEALIGLWKACTHFDEGRDTSFTAFATPCICNNIRMILRRRKQPFLTVPLDEPVVEDEKLTLADCIEDPAGSAEDSGVFIMDALNRLSEKDRAVLEHHLLGRTGKEAGRHLGISQSYYSRRLSAVKNKLIMNGGTVS